MSNKEIIPLNVVLIPRDSYKMSHKMSNKPNQHLLSTEEKLKIIDDIETIFVTGQGMPTSANDEIMKKLRALKLDQEERTDE